MLEINNSFVLLIDVQEKIFKAMYEKKNLINNICILIKGIKLFSIPIIISEQYPEGLGKTLPEITNLLPEQKVIKKLSFSCYLDKECKKKIIHTNRKQIILIGIETHVCIYQTAIDLYRNFYDVFVIVDAISSRKKIDYKIAIHNMKNMGIKLLTVEMLLFNLLKTSQSNNFKQISKLLR